MATKKTEEMNLADVQAQIQAMLAEAKAEADKIVAEAKAAVAPKTHGMTEEELKAYHEYMNERVKVKLFRDNDKYSEPVFVSVNGEAIAIERGVEVEIKRKHALVLDCSDKQDYETAKLIASKSQPE